ncbi:hypothetical protein M3Y97_00341400 [Aphelenchoides bicaudatus]|nr:hypothetical protein M3Y97_00341400 [Aphelenchoides bicaudatus]
MATVLAADTFCINMTYVPEKHGFQTALAVHGQAPYYGKEVMTEHKHQPTCFEMLREYATVCPRLYNFEQTTNEISACVEIEARLYHVKVARKKIGCLRVPI